MVKVIILLKCNWSIFIQFKYLNFFFKSFFSFLNEYEKEFCKKWTPETQNVLLAQAWILIRFWQINLEQRESRVFIRMFCLCFHQYIEKMENQKNLSIGSNDIKKNWPYDFFPTLWCILWYEKIQQWWCSGDIL